MFLTATTEAVDLINISILNAGIVALLGYAVVFFGLILLMGVIMALGKYFVAQDAKAKAAAPAPVEAALELFGTLLDEMEALVEGE